MELCHIVAVSADNVIGKNNQLPWHFSEDLKRFKNLTMGETVIMGRRTFESIGKPLPGRENFVLSRSCHSRESGNPDPRSFDRLRMVSEVEPLKHSGMTEKNKSGVMFFNSISDALAAVKTRKAFIIGGASLFEQTLAIVDGIYLTKIKGEYEGDVFYPEIPSRFREKERIVSEENPKLEYITYEKK